MFSKTNITFEKNNDYKKILGANENEKFVTILKETKMMLIKDERCHRVSSNNAVVLFAFSSFCPNLSEACRLCIERCFPKIADSCDFQHLDFSLVMRILSSDGLNIDTELEVVEAVIAWISLSEGRQRHATDLLTKVRLHLLSPAALNSVLKNTRIKIDGCVVRQILNRNKNLTGRYCSQNNFDIACAGGKNIKDNQASDARIILQASCHSTVLPRTSKKLRAFPQVVCIKGEIYVIGGFKNIRKERVVMSVVKFAANAWEKVSRLPDRRCDFSACSFMDSIYVVGGNIKKKDTDRFFEFNSKSGKWKEIARYNQPVSFAHCTVYEGKIVVSGGHTGVDDKSQVSCYDHVTEAWSYMGAMKKTRYGHVSIAIRSKLFVIGGRTTNTSEVFDSFCGKFVLLEKTPASFDYFLEFPINVVSSGRELVVFVQTTDKVVLYDMENNTWSWAWCGGTKNFCYYHVAKLFQH